MFEKDPDLYQASQCFQQDCTPNILLKNLKSEYSIDNRTDDFFKSSNAAAQQYTYQVYSQIQTWLGNDLQPNK